jgi:hypothetical protein
MFDAVEDAMYIVMAPWAQAGHFNERAAELRAAREDLLSRANPAGSIHRLDLLATIHEAYRLWFDTSEASVFAAGPVQVAPVGRIGGLPSDSASPLVGTYRARVEDMNKIRQEAMRAIEIAFNKSTFPLTQGAVDTRHNALLAEMEAFRHSREQDTPLMLLHNADLRQEVMSARIGSGILEEGATGADGIELQVGARRLPLNSTVRDIEGTMLWHWEIVGAVPEGVRFSEGGEAVPNDPATTADAVVESANVPTGANESFANAGLYFPETIWRGDDRITAPVTFTVRVTLYGSLPEAPEGEEPQRPMIMASNAFPITLVP